MKPIYSAIVASIVTAAVILYLTNRWSEEDRGQHNWATLLDTAQPSVQVDLGQHYMCLTSAEYDQLHLPEEFRCTHCEITGRSRELVEEGYKMNKILLAIRAGDTFEIQEIDISSIDHTSEIGEVYQGIDHDKINNMSQCTFKRKAVASCYEFPNHCVLLFEEQ